MLPTMYLPLCSTLLSFDVLSDLAGSYLYQLILSLKMERVEQRHHHVASVDLGQSLLHMAIPCLSGYHTVLSSQYMPVGNVCDGMLLSHIFMI
jgi:hypothetical protein